MLKKIINKIFPPVEFVHLKLKPIEENKSIVLDRNYHHYVITDHTQKRMIERKISYSEINLALKYGEETDDGVVLRITHVPEFELSKMDNSNLKAITYLLPLTVILNKKDKIIKTVYPCSKIYIKERVVLDAVKKQYSNRYTKKLKNKIIDSEKQKKKLAKKLRPYKEFENEY